MSIFKNPMDEDKLCQVLKAYVEEWGPEYVIVSVPHKWQNYSAENFGLVRLEYATADTVSIRVDYENKTQLAYAVQLQAA